MQQPISATLRFSPAAGRTHVPTPVPINELPLWAITRSYYEMGQHLTDANYKTLSRRLGTELQTTRKWIMNGWSRTTLDLVDREDIMDQLAANRSYVSIANELCVDELALRKWVKKDPDALRAAEEYKAEIQIDQAKLWVKTASDATESKAASSLLTHAQWAAERLYRSKFRPTGETTIMPMAFNFDLGPAAPIMTTISTPEGNHGGITLNHAPVQSGPDPLQALQFSEADDRDHGSSGFGKDFPHSDVASR